MVTSFLLSFLMNVHTLVMHLEPYLFILFLGIFTTGIYFTIISRGIQFRAFPEMIRLLVAKPVHENNNAQTISPRKALFTAMSTTIGIGNVIGPVVAIGFGGPGALVCYILASIFGAATTYTEVALSLIYRKKNADGSISGGPMPYLEVALNRFWATIYALAASALLVAWSASQSNTLACLVKPYGVEPIYTGLFLATTVLLILFSGLKFIATLSEALVPLMFIVYCGATLWIIGCHATELPATFSLIFSSFFNPTAMTAGISSYSIFETMRWGFARATQANEAGVGTATIPHSMSQSNSPFTQGVLAMASVFSNGIICLLSGLAILLGTNWTAPGTIFDAQLMAQAFSNHFNEFGAILIGASAFLFAFGTILGNCYNGSQCFSYVTNKRFIVVYQVFCALAVLLGTLFDLRYVWGFTDFFIIPVVIPHIIGIVVLAYKRRNLFDRQA